MLGINGSEFIVLLAVAAVVLGPERLPRYTQQLTQLIRQLRRMATTAQEKAREELGPEFDEVDWRALDPRQYDPRRIVREALSDAVDLDDPLGIRNDPLGLKSRSPGGPTPVAATANPADTGPANTSANTSANGARPAPADDRDAPAFDPDAT